MVYEFERRLENRTLVFYYAGFPANNHEDYLESSRCPFRFLPIPPPHRRARHINRKPSSARSCGTSLVPDFLPLSEKNESKERL